MKINMIIPSFHSISGGNIYNRKVFSRLQREKSIHLNFWSIENSIKKFQLDHHDVRGQTILIDSLFILSIFKQFPDIFNQNKIIGLIHLPVGMDSDHVTAEIRTVEAAAFKSCHHLICTSSFIKKEIHGQYNITLDRIDVARPGVEQMKKKTHYDQLPKNLICVSNLIGRKNLSLIISSCSQLQKKDWKLDIFGRLDMEEKETIKIKKQIKALGLTENIYLQGKVEHDNILGRLSEYDLMLFSSSFETYGMVVAESIQTRLPYLSTHVGESDYFKNFGIGIHVHQEEEYSRNLQEITTIQKSYSSLVNKAKTLELDLPHWDEVAVRFRDILFKIA